MYEGSCLCRNVKYEIDGELGEFGFCQLHELPQGERLGARGERARRARASFASSTG
jgi:hypothetical protein